MEDESTRYARESIGVYSDVTSFASVRSTSHSGSRSNSTSATAKSTGDKSTHSYSQLESDKTLQDENSQNELACLFSQ